VALERPDPRRDAPHARWMIAVERTADGWTVVRATLPVSS